MLPETSIGGGGNGEGSLVAVAVVVNTDDKPLDVPAGRTNVDDITITVTRWDRTRNESMPFYFLQSMPFIQCMHKIRKK
jgi:hypothetical protein